MNTSTRADEPSEFSDRPEARDGSGAPARVPHTIEDLTAWLIERVSVYLQRPPEEIDPREPLAEYGLDSVAALSLCGDVEEDFDLVLDPTTAWDYPTVNAFAGFVLKQLTDGDGGR